MNKRYFWNEKIGCQKSWLHADILRLIKEKSGTPTKHTFSDAYLRNNHARYAITIPVSRSIAKDWMLEHAHLTSMSLISMLIPAPSSTEKTMAGILLGYSDHEQRKFNPDIFNSWLDHLNGWAEVDACTSKDCNPRNALKIENWQKNQNNFFSSLSQINWLARMKRLIFPYW